MSASDPSDHSALLEQIRDGDVEAFRQIVADVERELTPYCKSLGGPEWEDLYQEALGRLWTNPPESVTHATLLPWLKRVARNLNIDRVRALKISEPLDEAIAPTSTRDIQVAHARLQAQDILSSVRPADSKLLYDHYIADKPVNDLAVARRSSVEATHMALSRARSKARTVARRIGYPLTPLLQWLGAPMGKLAMGAAVGLLLVPVIPAITPDDGDPKGAPDVAVQSQARVRFVAAPPPPPPPPPPDDPDSSTGEEVTEGQPGEAGGAAGESQRGGSGGSQGSRPPLEGDSRIPISNNAALVHEEIPEDPPDDYRIIILHEDVLEIAISGDDERAQEAGPALCDAASMAEPAASCIREN